MYLSCEGQRFAAEPPGVNLLAAPAVAAARLPTA